MSLKKVLDIPETVVASDTTIDGDGSEESPLSINAKTSSSIEGNGKVGNPLKINYVDLTSSIAGSGTKANNGKLDADIHVNSPLSGKGTGASPLAIGDASGTDKGVVSLTIESEIPAQNGSDDTAITPEAVKKLVKYIKPVAASGAMSAEQQSANAIPVPFLQNFTCDGGTNGKPKFDVPKEDGTFCNIDLGALGSSSSSSGIPAGFFEDIGMVVPNGRGCVTVKNGIYDYVYMGITIARAVVSTSGRGSCAAYAVPDSGNYGSRVVMSFGSEAGAPYGSLYVSPSPLAFPGGRWVKVL